jgi:uncharacterized protein with FMN-binding domain
MKARLLTLSSAAVLAVYTAGYARTRSAAEMLDAEDRRPPMPRPDSVDRTPMPAPPSAAQPPSADASHQAPAEAPAAVDHAGARRSTSPAEIADNVDTSRRNPDATLEKRAVRAIAPATSVAVQAPQAPKATQPAAVTAQATDSRAALMPQASVAVAVPAAPSAEGGMPQAAPQVPAAPDAPAVAKWKDGRYTGWGTSRHGDIQATIQIDGGRIATASISQCLTRYPCDWITRLPGQVVQRQSAETDFISGATESTNAFYYAILEALSKAK